MRLVIRGGTLLTYHRLSRFARGFHPGCAKPPPMRASDVPASAGHETDPSRITGASPGRSREPAAVRVQERGLAVMARPKSRGHCHACTRWSSSEASTAHRTKGRLLLRASCSPSRPKASEPPNHSNIGSPPPSSPWPQTQSSQENHVPRPPHGDHTERNPPGCLPPQEGDNHRLNPARSPRATSSLHASYPANEHPLKPFTDFQLAPTDNAGAPAPSSSEEAAPKCLGSRLTPR